ncbi:ankyrin repeat domain family member sosondowah isoform X2 [Amblyomma americanum]
MTDIEEFNFELVKQFLLDRGGKVTNPELVRNFRHYLNDPVHKDHVRQRFKDFVNRLASVKEENGTKYLILRNEYFEELQSSRREFTVGHNGAMEETDSSVGVMQQDHADYFAPSQGQTLKHLQWRQFTQDYPMIGDECPPLSPVGASRIRSSPCLLDENCYEDVPPPLPKKKNSFGGSPKRPDMPLPPPRGRKNHGRRGSQVEERVRQFSVEKELEGNVSPKEKTIQDVTVSPGTVKEKTQIINRMAESSGVPAKPALPSSGLGTITSKRREGPGARAAPDDDTTSVNTLDPRRREWLLRAAQTDYHSLVRLLREDPDLYRFEVSIESITALHWAAKYGSAEIVKLIAGSYSLNPNVKSVSGLHTFASGVHVQPVPHSRVTSGLWSRC